MTVDDTTLGNGIDRSNGLFDIRGKNDVIGIDGQNIAPFCMTDTIIACTGRTDMFCVQDSDSLRIKRA